MKSVHGNQSRRVGDEPTIPHKAFKRKRPTARDTSDLLFRKQKELSESHPPQARSRLDLGCVHFVLFPMRKRT